MTQPQHHNSILAQRIKEKALELNFDAVGFAPAQSVNETHQKHLDQWLKNNYHGQMHYMANHKEKRTDPTLLVPGAKTVICLAMNYHQKDYQHPEAHYKVSQYAAGIDYHHTIKKKLYALLEFIREQTSSESARVFTDSAPVMERYWAQQCGLGASGKNSCLIIPRKGSYFFLAEIILDIELPYDTPFEKDLCGKCTRCMEACPTGAITSPGSIDARRCISYLTIELKDPIPEEFTGKTEGYIFGCDICQQVCPHNIKFATPCKEPGFEPVDAIKTFTRVQWEGLDKSTFRKSFTKAGSPLARVKPEKLMGSMGK
ncbi:MAG: tRNA epoxyqueuosine(34) reductase QueG [Bacteroidetes bacterium]|nr:MAG: tRNA epoxyqueuosine(34) reductase QueG [Bacteroidota bacterium]